MKELLRKYKYLRYAVKTLLAGFAAVLLLILFIFIGVFGKLPSKDDLAAIRQESATQIVSADGKIIGKIFAKNRTQVDSSEMPQHLLDALVATEDKRFYEHNGVDLRSYGRVIVKSFILMDDSGGGGSTITQQLAKNLFGRPNYWILTMPVSKIKEVIIARRLEKVYTKHQLLVLYFNTVPFGENTWGIEAAASRFFNTQVSDLTVAQSALLVGMLKANTAFNPKRNPQNATSRRNVVLNLMLQQQVIDSAAFAEHSQEPVELDYTNYELYNPSGHFVYRVTEDARDILDALNAKEGTNYDIEKDGLEIVTTLNYQMQLFAVEAAKNQLVEKQKILDKELATSAYKKEFFKQNAYLLKDTTKKYRAVFVWNDSTKKPITRADSAWMHQSMLSASVLAIQPQTGEVVVWVGGNNFRYVPYDLVQAKRQSASAFKPIVYAAALESGFTPCDYFSNVSITYPEFENWKPENYDGQGGGEVAMWYALSRSLNVPTVDLYMKTGHSKVEQTAAALGLILPRKVRPAVSLGAQSFSLKEMTRAYAAFANKGYIQDLVLIKEIKDADGKVIYSNEKSQGRKSITNATAQEITKMLRTAVREGTGQRLAGGYGVRSEIAGKTGTSQNYSDAWFMSYNQDLVCGVWVGAMSPQVHFRGGGNGSGSALALPIAGRFYKKVEGNSVLRKKYLTGFYRLNLPVDSVSCPGVVQPEDLDNYDSTHEEEDEGFLKETLNKIFKR